jgi:hypothetical protein
LLGLIEFRRAAEGGSWGAEVGMCN